MTYHQIFLAVENFNDDLIKNISALFTKRNVDPSTNQPKNSPVDNLHSKN